MREIIARIVCAFAGCVVVALSLLFAWRHNPPATMGVTRSLASPTSGEVKGNVERGRRVYMEQHCATCHSVAGVGNPRHPLDRIGVRRTVSELREWITATGSAEGKLSDAVARRKSKYRKLPAEEWDALVAYLQSFSAQK